MRKVLPKNYTTPSVAKSTLDKAERTQNKVGWDFFLWLQQRGYIVSKTFHFVYLKGKYWYNGRETVHALLIIYFRAHLTHKFN